MPSPARTDLVASALALLVVTATAVAGAALNRAGAPLFADAAPLFGFWHPHVGLGTPLAVAVAVVVIAWGPLCATRLPWRPLLAAGYAAALAWTVSLALGGGWRAGITDRLTDWTEYLHDVPRVHDVGAVIGEFNQHVLAGQPGSWTVHVSGHPPGALVFYTWLDRLGLGGGTWASTVTLLVGGLAAVAVPVTVKALRDEDAARAVVPFVVLFPGAVWMGVSADGLFTGVTATGIALLAMRRAVPVLLGGVLLGFALFLSYGLVLVALIAVAVVGRAWWKLPVAAAGALLVVGVFAAHGFWWLDGYHLVVQRYHQGEFAQRPYAYWVFGNLGAFLLSAGPLVVAALGRARLNALSGPVLAAGAAVVLADLSGLSKAEVERIWLPFGVWFAVAGALLPARSRRWWLGVQAVTALSVEHVIATSW
ncbi:hypothetical protein EIL87_03175 [Saccharopolyspora rhizosphaerae]|uniref:DUF2029 domain-containing protein n=1 Tax=Saccharopolyspora rhizosphaerae TaxID=2492662 RepID=A0A3R8QUT3_9PSEU|nr:hypothetical protein [Saccharopolyspora rhizosphaerae]RRO19988.1 hypothetical protein EIL87_03175 [Saccharopolyspora rhizosphaerae]